MNTTCQQRSNKRRVVVAALATAFAVGGSLSGVVQAGSDEDLFGDTITLLLPTAPGGGVDASGSFVAQYLADHIPGSPDIVIQHEPGGGTVNGTNIFQNRADTDGSVFFLSTTSTYLHQLAGNEAADYDFTQWQPLAADCGQSGVFVRTETGFDGTNYEELPEIESFKLGLSGWTTAQSVYLLALDALGIPVDAIPGYQGTAELFVAFSQGETTVGSGGADIWMEQAAPLFESGEAVGLFTFPRTDENGEKYRDPMAPEDVPMVHEAYEMIHGEEPSGETWDALMDLAAVSYDAQNVFWYHPDVPQEYVDAMREAFVSLAGDQEFIDAQAKSRLLCGDTLMTGEQLDRAVGGLQGFQQSSADLWLEVLREYGYEG